MTSLKNFFSSSSSKNNTKTPNNKNINQDDDTQSLATQQSFNNNNDNKNKTAPSTVANTSSLSGWVDVAKEIQFMAWPICCAYLNGDCEYMERPSCCAYLHDNPLGSSRPCEHGDKCDFKHLKRHWEPDSSVDRCRNCLKEFGVIRRKSHCRECGRIICKDCCKVVSPIGKICAVCEFKLKVAAQTLGPTMVPSMRHHNSAELLAKYTDFSPEKMENNHHDTKNTTTTTTTRTPIADNTNTNQGSKNRVYGRNGEEEGQLSSRSVSDNDEEIGNDNINTNASYHNNMDFNKNQNTRNSQFQDELLWQFQQQEQLKQREAEEENRKKSDEAKPQKSESDCEVASDEKNEARVEDDPKIIGEEINCQQQQQQEDDEIIDDDEGEMPDDQDDQVIQLKKRLAGEIAAHGYDDNTQDEFFDILFQLAERYEQLILNLKHEIDGGEENAEADGSKSTQKSSSSSLAAAAKKRMREKNHLLHFYKQQRTEILSKLLRIRETVYGEQHQAAAQILTMMGEAHRNDGELLESEQVLKKALAICEVEYGVDDAETANVLSHLGVTYHLHLVRYRQQNEGEDEDDENDDVKASALASKQDEYLRRSIEIYEKCGETDIANEMRHAWNIF